MQTSHENENNDEKENETKPNEPTKTKTKSKRNQNENEPNKNNNILLFCVVVVFIIIVMLYIGKAWANKKNWRTTDVLIIDEISMINGTLFDTLEALARDIRADPRPFGGIQLVCTGDFFQLPPVSK